MSKNKTAEFEAKYPHVVKGSVRNATPEEVVGQPWARHGHVCQIKCVDCGTLRMISKQDAYQVSRCSTCQKDELNKRRAAKQAQRAAAAREAKKVAMA